MTERRPTIDSVTEHAGASKSMVPLMMRVAPQVGPASSEAVLPTARDLGYRPHSVARSFVAGHTRAVGMTVPGLRNPWYVDVLDGFRWPHHADSRAAFELAEAAVCSAATGTAVTLPGPTTNTNTSTQGALT